MASVPNLDDVNQTVICIPYAGSEDECEERLPPQPIYSPYQYRDFPDGFELRMEVYRTAWQICVERVQSIIEALHAPKIRELAEDVRSAYSPTKTIPNLPYPEIPAFSVHGPPTFLQDVTRDIFQSPTVSGCHLHPSDCPNITAAMKTLVQSFVTDSSSQANSKKRPAASLAAYDINTLTAWYEHVNARKCTQLVVIFHQFEQFDSSVLQDLFYICSLTIPKVPLVFIFSLSSPPTPSFIHATYPRDTLALLRLKSAVAPQGWPLVKEILEQTFFSLDYEPDAEPDVMIGPPVLEFILDYFTRYNSSTDAILTILQLTYLKHFDEPLTLLARDSHLGTDTLEDAEAKLSQPSSLPFLDSLLTRTAHPPASDSDPADDEAHWQAMSVSSILTAVDTTREEFKAHLRDVRIAYRLMNVAKAVLVGMGYSISGGRNQGKVDVEREVIKTMCRAIRGRCGRESKSIGAAVKGLSLMDAKEFLSSLHRFFQELPSHVRRREDKSRVKIVSWNSQLQRHGNKSEELLAGLTEAIGDWLIGYFDERLKSLEECSLWDIWYTGSSPFPSELINPAPRATIISALLYPHEYAQDPDALFSTGESQVSQQAPQLWELPDTSILFKRYLEGGKMINVYDWYESFALVLESQKVEGKRQGEASAVSALSPSKDKGRGKAWAMDDEGENEVDEEQWRMQVQARFIRALHELDYMGFIKHTGRKADHVLKTVFDVLD